VSIEENLRQRAENRCELCGSEDDLRVFEVSPSDGTEEKAILVCKTCEELIAEPNKNPNHWRCLNDSMWSQTPAVQVMAYRILDSIKDEGWPNEMLEMLYLEPETLEWAKETLKDENAPVVRDSNGNTLDSGDSVVIIKDLPVKGAGFTAKQGTVVKNIKLVADDPTHIEGRVNGVRIYLKTEFLKKA